MDEIAYLRQVKTANHPNNVFPNFIVTSIISQFYCEVEDILSQRSVLQPSFCL